MSGRHDPPAIPVPIAPASAPDGTGHVAPLASTDGAAALSPTTAKYNGFIAGIFSGVSKLVVGHPFDTIKVRLQTSPPSRFAGPLACVAQTFRHEGLRGFYKGATPPLVGWMFMDSLMLGSLTTYRRLLREHVFTGPINTDGPRPPLPVLGHALAGMGAGWTVSFLAAPVEHVKLRLQLQYAAHKSQRLYSGPVDCTTKILRTHGIRGLFRGLPATMLFRSWFFVWWGSYDVLSRAFATHTALSQPAIDFWAGGLSAELFWLSSYPVDAVKQRIMSDPLGGADGTPRFRGRWLPAARDIWQRDGVRGYWRGFVPCALRAFPANAVALLVFESVMRSLPQ